jgi:Family of unknown function (DUF6494)
MLLPEDQSRRTAACGPKQLGRAGRRGKPPGGPLWCRVPSRDVMQQRNGVMNEDNFNMSVRKFLKVVGVTSQREIEAAVRAALKSGKLAGNEKLAAKVTLSVPGIGLSHEIDGDIELG